MVNYVQIPCHRPITLKQLSFPLVSRTLGAKVSGFPTLVTWFAAFLLKAFVSRVNRLLPMRIERLERPT